MRTWHRGWILPALGALVAVMALGSCGGDKKKDDGGDGTKPGGHAGDVRNGTWTVTSEFTSNCPDIGNSTDHSTPVICNLESYFEYVESGQSVGCEVHITGKNYTISCSGDSTLFGICKLHVDLDGSGNFTDTTYVFDGTVHITPQPLVTGGCGTLTACTATIHEIGFWLNGDGACTDSTTSAAGRFVRREFRTILGPQ